MRLAAARTLGEEAVDTLLEMVGSSVVPVKTRAAAIELVADFPAHESVLPVLERCLDSTDDPIVQSAVRAIGRMRVQTAVPKLKKLITRVESTTAKVLVWALGRIANPKSEGFLLLLLDGNEDELRAEAARALGRFASIKAVEPLLRLTKGMRLSSQLKDSARSAIKQIQERAGEVEPGRLSVVDSPDEGGRVSLIADGGALAVADEKD